MASASGGEGLPRQSDYRLLFDTNPQPMWVLDVETRRFLAVNDAAVARYGYSRAELLAMTSEDLLPPEDVPASAAGVGGASRGAAAGGVLRHRTKDGRTLSVEVSATSLTFAGRRAEIVIPTDVGERLQLEKQLRHAQKMEAVGRLAGGVAHDFNNMLTVVLGYSELALLKLSEEDALHKDLVEIRAAGGRAAALTRQLLTFSRRQAATAQILDVGAVVAEMSKLLQRVIGEDVKLVTRIEPAVARVQADRGHLEQVLMSLSVHARDAMPSGGRLSIEVANVLLDEKLAHHRLDLAPGHYVMLAVSDSGAGIDEETGEDGSGLGLATVHGIVRENGGSIAVQSEAGCGTTFRVYLPAVVGTADAVVERPISALRQGHETVLLLEDDALVRDVAQRVLRSSGYCVLVAATGAEAEAILREREGIALVVSDVVLPHMSGREAVERLLAIQPSLRVLFMSGHADEAILRGGYLPPGAAFVEKPFTPQSLADKVREVLDRAST